MNKIPATWIRTEVLDVLISQETDDAARHLGASLGASLLGLVDDNAVGEGGGDKGGAIAEDGHTAVVIHAQPREAVADGGDDKGEVAGAWLAVWTRRRIMPILSRIEVSVP